MEETADKSAGAPHKQDGDTSKKHKRRSPRGSGAHGQEVSAGAGSADEGSPMQRSKRPKGSHRRHRSPSGGHAGVEPEANTLPPAGGSSQRLHPSSSASASASISASAAPPLPGTGDRPPQQPERQVVSPNLRLVSTPSGGTPARRAGATASAMLSPYNAAMLSPAELPRRSAEAPAQQPLAAQTTATVSTSAAGLMSPDGDKGEGQRDNDVVPLVAVTLVACGILIAVVLFKVLPNTTYTATKSHALCKTSACVEYAQRLSSTVNWSIDACRDFYSHVCNGWKTGESVMSDLASRFSVEAVKALTSAGKVTTARAAQSAVQKAALLYQSCEKVITAGQSELGRFRPMLKDVGVHWPNQNPSPDVLRTLLRLISKMALHVLFSIKQEEAVRDRNVSVLEVRAVTRYLNEAKRRRERIEASGRAKDFYGALFDAFNAKGSPSVDYDAFRQIEQEGLAAFAPALQPVNSSDELDYTTPPQTGLESLARATPDISEQRWETQLREQKILASGSNATLAVSARAATVLGALSSLVKRRGEMDAELFVGWLVLQEVAPLVSKDLAEAIDVAGNVVAGHQQRCLALAEMLLGWAVLAPFTDSAASLTTRLSIENLAAFIEQALHDAVGRSEWLRNMDVGELPSASTGSFLEKIAEFPRLLDLDPAYRWMADMVEHLTDNWNRSVRSRRAEPVSLWRRVETRFFEPGDIEGGHHGQPASLSPSALLMPAYVHGTSAAHRFGALGSRVATHLFLLLHQSVRRAGGHDQLSRRLACYAPTRDHRESGTEEAALGLAWQAYRSSAPEDTRLEGLEQFSGDQLFFVAFAFLHCTSSEGVHAESQLVNSAVRNVDGFASSFNCAPGAPMNPEAKCSYF